MKIGVICYPSLGGSGIVATEIGTQLADRGHEIHFISSGQPFRLGAYHSNFFLHQVDSPSYPLFQDSSYMLSLVSKMVRVAEDNGLDILHCHYAIPHAIAAHLAREMLGATRIKIVTTMHGTDVTLVGQEEAFFKPTKFALQRSDGLTTVSHYLARETERVFSVPLGQIAVIHNFVDRERFAPMPAARRDKLRKRYAPSGELIVMHLSNFRPVKRPQDVIQTFCTVRAKVPAKLLLVGEGPMLHPSLKHACADAKRNDIVLLGKQVAVWELLPLADIYLLTSELESFGLSVLEAMACGVPVVASRTGGIPEVVNEGQTGFLAGIGRVDEFSAHILRLAQDTDLRQQMGRAAREWTTQFDSSAIVSQYEKFYENVLSTPSGGK